MGAFQSVAVPFVKIGNRRCLTAMQLVEDTELRAFVERFVDSFEFDPVGYVWLFIEPDSGHERHRPTAKSLIQRESERG